MPYIVYMLRCADNTLYTGITNDLKRRLTEHNSGRAGAKYTYSRRPVVLVHQETMKDRSAALKREYRIRKLAKEAKEKLIEQG